MRVLVVGAGGTGGYYGGRLFQAGRDVSFLVRPARAVALRERGLEIVSPSGDATLHPPLVLASGIAAPYDVVFLSVKAYALEQAIDDFAPAIGPETMIVPVLNGMRHIELLVARFGEKPVLGGVSQIAMTVDGQGRIVHLTPLQKLAYGERAQRRAGRCGHAARQARSAARFDERNTLRSALVAGDRARYVGEVGDARHARWHHLPDARHDRRDRSRPGGAGLARAMLDECVAVARACGHAPSEEFIEPTAKFLTTPGSPAASSMYRDMSGGLNVEVDQILGDLVKRGQAHSLKTPLLAAAFANLRVYRQRLEAASAKKA